jgi:hypothetical protein
MSWEATKWAREDAGIPSSLRAPYLYAVLVTLASYANDVWQCWPSTSTIARNCRQSERGVRNVLDELESLGLLETKERRGRTSMLTLTPARHAGVEGEDTPAHGAGDPCTSRHEPLHGVHPKGKKRDRQVTASSTPVVPVSAVAGAGQAPAGTLDGADLEIDGHGLVSGSEVGGGAGGVQEDLIEVYGDMLPADEPYDTRAYGKRIKVRETEDCASCDMPVFAGDRGMWDKENERLYHVVCPSNREVMAARLARQLRMWTPTKIADTRLDIANARDVGGLRKGLESLVNDSAPQSLIKAVHDRIADLTDEQRLREEEDNGGF